MTKGMMESDIKVTPDMRAEAGNSKHFLLCKKNKKLFIMLDIYLPDILELLNLSLNAKESTIFKVGCCCIK